MKRKNKRLVAILAVVLWAIFVLLLVVFAQDYTNRDSKSDSWDSNCLTQLNDNPLKECRRSIR